MFAKVAMLLVMVAVVGAAPHYNNHDSQVTTLTTDDFIFGDSKENEEVNTRLEVSAEEDDVGSDEVKGIVEVLATSVPTESAEIEIGQVLTVPETEGAELANPPQINESQGIHTSDYTKDKNHSLTKPGRPSQPEKPTKDDNTTLDPLTEFCKEACSAGVGGPECDCPDHPIG